VIGNQKRQTHPLVGFLLADLFLLAMPRPLSKIAKLGNDMTLFKKYQKVAWGVSPNGHPWEARVFADVDSNAIEVAKTIVDHCSPQRYGPHGTNRY
jgi:hypothetical protein